jgi:alpha-methylacyl-CoA racemase
VYETSDGGHMAVGPLEPQFFAELLDRLGLSGLDQFDPGLRPVLREAFAARTRDEWAEVFADSDACVAPVLSLSEAPDHPHLAARKTFEIHDGVRQPAPAPRFSRTPASLRSPEPGDAWT